MSNVFISYSRKNRDFASRLVNTLEKDKKDVWVDWQDIPSGTQFLDEIFDGIDNAETFIVVVSEDSLMSEICNYEIERAREANKRIIPIIFQRIEGDVEKRVKGTWFGQKWQDIAVKNWEAIRHIDWIFADAGKDFDEVYRAVLMTVDTDTAHVKAHTRYFVQAKDWLQANQNPSFLLTGDALIAAELWLRNAEDESKKPAPTESHGLFIAQSRKVENERNARIKRLQIVTRSATVGILLLIMIAAGAGWVTYNTNEQLFAVRTATIPALLNAAATQVQYADNLALGTELSLNSISLSASEFDLAILLELASRQYWGASNTTYRRLVQMLETNRYIKRYLREHQSEITSVAASPDGHLLVSGDTSGVIHVWNSETHEHIATVDAHEDQIRRVVFSPTGQFFATSSHDSSVKLWDTHMLELLADPLPANHRVRGLAISPDAKTLIYGDLSSSLHVWDISDPQHPQHQATINQPHFTVVNAIEFSPDGRILATGDDDSRVAFWDIETGIPVFRNWEKAHGSWILDLSFSGDGSRLVSASGDRTLILWDSESGEVLYRTEETHDSWILGVDFSPHNDNLLVSAGNAARLLIWQVNNDELTVINELYGHRDSIRSARFGINGLLYTGSRDTSLIVWDVISPSAFGDAFGSHEGAVRTVEFSPDGDLLASGDSRGMVSFWSVPDGQHLSTIALERISEERLPRINALSFGHNSNLLAIAADNTPLQLVDISDPSEPRLIREITNTTSSDFTTVGFHPHRLQMLAGERTGRLSLWEISDPRRPALLREVQSNHRDLRSMTFNRDGTAFFTAGWSRRAVQEWDLELTNLATYPTLSIELINTVKYAHNSDQLLAAGFPRSLSVWFTPANEPRNSEFEFAGHFAEINDLDLSPDDSFLVTASDDRTVILWDFLTAEKLALPFRGHTGEVITLAYSPNGQYVAAGDRDGHIILWHLNANAWINRACTIVNRDLSSSEIDQFIGDRPYVPVCPNNE